MKSRLALVALTLSGILFVGAQPALAAGPHVRVRSWARRGSHRGGLRVHASGLVTQRDPRTLTTWTDRRGAIVLQTLRTVTTTEYAGGSGGTMLLDENSLVTQTPNREGTSTILFVGRGAIWGTDTTSRPVLLPVGDRRGRDARVVRREVGGLPRLVEDDPGSGHETCAIPWRRD